ncbi:sec-independent translocase [Glutamicibacter protophormiae]|uniref:Sec-independent protein translocase protein TatB n=1 Tax=Glutamicibacter protophormiae TaxID=37930 RepID=A0ABS4XUN3_GLUPR|nr:sec-independent translocase [Glutamicibacter protophormiae]MBP2400214.1 sec-independent protein translocase protein TatB [Glutamicibacter protophormiae]GGL74398.1 translocase [Glutamicibacter protophormiae]
MDFLGINGGEFIILAIIAVVVLGPEKLPDYAKKLANLVKEIRRMANGAKEQLREEVGDEVADMDWRKLDPRQYDPRRIIKEALIDEFDDAVNVAKGKPSSAEAAPVRTSVATHTATQAPLGLNEGAPFDDEAT